MNDTVTFAVFDKFLHRLGFTEGSVPGSHVYYEHPQSGTVVMARLHEASDPVPWHTFASTRKILLERRLVTPEEVDKMTASGGRSERTAAHKGVRRRTGGAGNSHAARNARGHAAEPTTE